MRPYENCDLAAFVRGYVGCLLWAESGDPESPLGETADGDELAEETRVALTVDCADFLNDRSTVSYIDSHGGYERGGHDFWLTRNGHGAGFWDRGYPQHVGDYLTARAEAAGSADAYRGDDGRIYLS